MKNILKKIILLIVLISTVSCKNIDTQTIIKENKLEDKIIKTKPVKTKNKDKIIKTIITKSKTELAVDKFIDLPEIKNASLGIKVVNLETNKTLFELDPNKSLVPASNMKILTGAAALEILGKDYRFKTTLAYDGKIDSKGTLNGNIYIIGGGDPTLGSRYLVAKNPIWITTEEKKKQMEFLNTWVEEIKTIGIKKINGNIITDPSYYPDATLSKTWEWGDLRYTFASKPSGLTFLDNSIRLTLTKDGKEIKTTVSPTYANTIIDNRAITNDKNSSQITLVASPYTNKITILGTMNRSKISYNTVMPDPASALGTIFSQVLEEQGIKNNKNISIDKFKKNKNKKTFIYTQYSPELGEIISYMNKYSVNLFAEHLKIEVEKKSYRTIKNYWNKYISTKGLYIYDGSGLSRYDGVTPNTIVEVFKHMKDSTNFSSFYDSLAEPGKNGTFQDFQKETVLVDNLHGKSGTLTGIKSYGGYIHNIDGDLLAFSIIINHHGMSNSKISKELEKIMESIYYLK